jgi:hypothetical protein
MASPTGNARDPMPAAAYKAAPPAAPAANPVMAGHVWSARLRAAPADWGSVPKRISIRSCVNRVRLVVITAVLGAPRIEACANVFGVASPHTPA